MENLNNLIWTDEDVNNGADIQSENGDMRERCMIAFCTFTGGTCYACSRIDSALSTAPILCNLG